MFSTVVQQTYRHEGLPRFKLGASESASSQSVVQLERLVRQRLKDLSKSIKSPRAARDASNRDLTPLQTLSIYRDAIKADEFALRFDTMTLGVIALQVIRIIQNSVKETSAGDDDIFEECCVYLAVDTFLHTSKSRGTMYGVVGECSKVWSLIQQIMDRVGNLSCTRALAEQCIVALPRNSAHEAQFASTAAIFGGPNSPESPNSWDNSWDQPRGHLAFEYRALPWELKTEEQFLEDKACDEFVQKLITIPWKTDNLDGIARHLGLNLW